MFKNVTLIILTHNRHNFLRRVLEYYTQHDIKIYICDSSDEPFLESSDVKYEYFHYKNYSYLEKIHSILQKVDTKYVVFSPDDDFIIFNGIKESIDFLNKYEDYIAAEGHFTVFENNNKHIFCFPEFLHAIGLDINSTVPSERIKELLSRYVHLFYSVYRTKEFQMIEDYLHTYKDKVTSPDLWELLFAITVVIDGKYKILPVFYGLRESHSGNLSSQVDFNHMDRIITGEKYKKEYEIFLSILTEYLLLRENLSENNAKQKIIESINLYMDFCFSEVTNNKKMRVEKIKKVKMIINSLSFGMAREIHKIVTLWRNSITLKGYPFSLFDFEAQKEYMKLTYLIKKHNI